MSSANAPFAARRKVRKRAAVPAREGWCELRRNGLCILQVSEFRTLPWLVHGFSTRLGGVSELADRDAVTPHKAEPVLNLGFADWDSRENVQENRRLFQSALDAANLALVPLRQFHSDLVHVFEAVPGTNCRVDRFAVTHKVDRFAVTHKADASLTALSGLLLGVQTADCVPILLVDPRRRAVAAIHAGWRGTLRRIAAKAVGRMQMAFGTRPADLLAALGPAIGGCCYEVGPEVAAAFHSQFAGADDWFDELRTGEEPNPLPWMNRMPPGQQPPPRTVLLDLRKANRAQLLDVGLSAKNIFVSDLCTACRTDLFFSYRRVRAVLAARKKVDRSAVTQERVRAVLAARQKVDRSAVTQERVRAVLAARKKVDRSAVTHKKEGPRTGRLLSVIGIRPSGINPDTAL